MIFTPVVILGPYVHQLKKVKEIKPELLSEDRLICHANVLVRT